MASPMTSATSTVRERDCTDKRIGLITQLTGVRTAGTRNLIARTSITKPLRGEVIIWGFATRLGSDRVRRYRAPGARFRVGGTAPLKEVQVAAPGATAD